jgi:hypothetical protein
VWAKIGLWARPVVPGLGPNLTHALFIFFSISKFVFLIKF